MSDDRFYLPPGHPDRPLQGLTVLVVEDSRFASEAIRLLSIRSGARIRRADSLAAAHRHLAVYRPSVLIADIGLPDGSGLDLIAELARTRPRVPAILGISGDPDAEPAARAAGADGFLAKPVESLALFQQALLAALPGGMGPPGPRAVSGERILPDPVALADDLHQVAALLRKDGRGTRVYVAQMLSGLAVSARDPVLAAAAGQLARNGADAACRRVAALVEERLSRAHAV